MSKTTRKTRTVKMSDEDWSNVVRFRAGLESSLGRTVTLGDALAISAKLNLLYISIGKKTKFTFKGTIEDLEMIGIELAGEELKEFIEAMKEAFGVVEKQSKTLREYREAAVKE